MNVIGIRNAVDRTHLVWRYHLDGTAELHHPQAKLPSGLKAGSVTIRQDDDPLRAVRDIQRVVV